MRSRFAALLLLLALGLAGTAQAQPNIVVLMLDDVRADDLKTLLDNGLAPNLQKYVVGQGITFDNSFVTTSLCGPSRATYLTGQYSHNHRVTCNLIPDQSHAVEMLNHDKTLPVWLRAAGYRTVHVGKYLNGYGSGTPEDVGPRNPTWIPPDWDDWHGLVDFSTYLMHGFTINHNKTLVEYRDNPETPERENYQTDVLARIAVRAIERAESADDRPLFLSITPLAAHYEHGEQAPVLACTNPWFKLTIRPATRHTCDEADPASCEQILPVTIQLDESPPFAEPDMRDKPPHLTYRLSDEDKSCLRTNYRERLKSLRAVDDLVGRVVAALRQYGEWSNTVFVVTSDNGFLLGEHHLTQKVYAYEPSIRVPLYIRVPAMSSGQRSPAFVVNNDLAATIAALAGAQPNLTLDGRSLVPLFSDPNPADWRRRFMVEYLGPEGLQPFQAVRTTPTDGYAPNAIAVFWSDGSRELYALDVDPGQQANLAGMPEFDPVLSYLKNQADQLKNCTGGECRYYEDQ